MSDLISTLGYDATLEHSSIFFDSPYLPHELPSFSKNEDSNVTMLYVGSVSYGHQFRGKPVKFGPTTVSELGDLIILHSNNSTMSVFGATDFDEGDISRWPIMALVLPQYTALDLEVYQADSLAALEERILNGEKQKGVAIYEMGNLSKSRRMETKRWKVVENTCVGLTCHDGTIITSCILNGVLFAKLISETSSDYIPVSSVSSSTIHESSILALCCSPDGSLFMLDAGRSLVYQLDMETNDCSSFGSGYLESPVDITYFGIFVVVLNKNGIVLFSAAAEFLRRFYFNFSSAPKSVCIADSTIIVTGENAEIFRFHIKME